MQYQFDGGSIGRCQVELRAAGKHGFAVPKIFEITCLDKPATPAYTFRFTDNVVTGMAPREFTNATLCRIVIAQFLLLAGEQNGATLTLDTNIPPFDGPVTNPDGVVLTFLRLYAPRGSARAAKHPEAPAQRSAPHHSPDESPDIP